MIQEVSGDILLSGAEVVAHGVAPNDHFNHGLALALRERYPAMYKDFRHFTQSTHAEPGEIWVWSGVGEHGTVRIAALLTQEGDYHQGGHAGRAHVEHVNHALKRLRKWIDREKPSSIALPRLATGVGGLDWKDVRPIIEHHLGDLSIPVVLYTTYHADQKAEEKL
jgi:O-acetyl-ADP-ribose deacetylase (regulator of RNase III)